jgi:hypothetical protein
MAFQPRLAEQPKAGSLKHGRIGDRLNQSRDGCTQPVSHPFQRAEAQSNPGSFVFRSPLIEPLPRACDCR